MFSQIPVNPADDSFISCQLNYNYFDLYRSESKSSYFKSYLSTKSLSIDYKKNSFLLSFSMQDPKLYITNKNNRDDNFAFNGIFGRRSIQPKIDYENDIVNLGSEFTIYENRRLAESSFNSYVEFKFNTTIINRFKIGLAKESESLFTDISYSTERILFDNDLKFYKLTQSFEVGKIFNSKWRFETFQQWKFDEGNISQTHHLNNSGNFYGANISAEFLDNKLSLSSNYFAGDGKLIFEYDKNIYGEEKFSDIVFFRGEIISTLLSTYNLIDEFKVGFMNFRGKSTGEIQSWPFTDVITSAIANRIYFRANFNIQNYYLQFKKQFKISSFEITPEILFLHLVPKGEFENWQPLFLVFGVKDFKQSKISYKNAGFAHLTLQFYIEVEKYHLTISGGQLIPIYQNKIESSSIGGPITTSSEKVKSDGGRWIELSLKYIIGF
ncbi:MAG: hypothetical protein Q8N03_17645 [Ignavibacteria bacterium]|nr:hypothetical protein [Ignavibacteria bacterium]